LDGKLIGFLTAKEREELRIVYKRNRDSRVSRRAHIILFLDKGYTHAQIAKLFFIDESTIRRYEEAYKAGGINLLSAMHYCGSKSFLSESQTSELKKLLSEKIYPTAQSICNLVEKRYSINYSIRGMVRLLEHIGFVYKKPQIVPGKADPKSQKEFVEKYETLKGNLGPHDKIYSMDGSHPQHNSKPAYGWFPKGEPTKLKTNTGRKRINLNGAICSSDGDAVFKSYDRIDSEAVVDTLKEVEKNNPKAEKIYVISDNARYNHSKKVREFVASSKIEIVYLPTYSPNLNVIERVWKFFHEKVTNNRYYEKFDEFNHAVMDFFKNLHLYKGELLTRIKDNFQIVSHA